MNLDNDSGDEWLEDVRRWYRAGGAASAVASFQQSEAAEGAMSGSDAIGDEAAYPALQARHWPDLPR